MTRLFAALAAGAALTAAATPAQALPLRPVEVSRFAYFLDLGDVRRQGDTVSLRYLMIVETDFEAGGERFQGGWSSLTLDCAARTADFTGFQSLRADGSLGPQTQDARPRWPIAAGSLEAVLVEAACDGKRPLDRPDATSVEEAVRLGRGWLAE